MILHKFPLSGINKVILFYYFLKNSKLHMLSNVAVRLHIFPASTSRQLATVKDTAMSYTRQPPTPIN